MGKKRRTEKKNHLFDWLNVLGVLEPRWMRIIIPITVPNQKNTGNKNVVVVVRRRHSLRLLAGWYRRFGYNFLSYLFMLKTLSSYLFRLSFANGNYDQFQSNESSQGSNEVLNFLLLGLEVTKGRAARFFFVNKLIVFEFIRCDVWI